MRLVPTSAPARRPAPAPAAAALLGCAALLAEDVIFMDFLRHPEYDGEFTVRGDGRLYLHDVGLVDVHGLSVDQFHDLVLDRYGRILVDPSIYVEVKSFSTRRKVAVQGYVARPGVIALPTPRTTILDAIALAGGVNTEGDRGAILIARRVNGQVEVARYDMDMLFAPSDPNMRTEIPYVHDGDYVYVLRSWGSAFDEEVTRWTQLLRGIAFLERDILNAPRTAEALQGDFNDDL